MNLITSALQNEFDHYKKLTQESRTIFNSIFLFCLAAPILSTFINAFIWRATESVLLVILFNFAVYIGVPLGFYLNGQLLKKYLPTTFYFIGCIAQGTVAALLLFIPYFPPLLIFSYGLVFGLTSGLYWGNRILLIISHVKSHQRIYFSSMVFMVQVLCGILVPLLIGWYLVLGEKAGIYSANSAYQILGVVLFLIMITVGLKMKKLKVTKQPVPYTTLRKPSRAWKKMRAMAYLMGFTNSIEIVFPTLLVLMFIGKEGKLGTIQALSGVFLAVALYHIGKKVGKDQRFYVLALGVFFSIMSGVIFSFSYTTFGVISYFVLSAFATPFRWTIFGPVSFDVIDSEVKKNSKNRYAYIFDQEFFINFGRNTSFVILALFYFFSRHSHSSSLPSFLRYHKS